MAKHEWTPIELVSRQELFQLGHFHSSFGGVAKAEDVDKLEPTDAEYKRAVSSYQGFANLLQDEDAGPKTLSSIVQRVDAFGYQRICDCPDVLAVSEESNISNGTQTWPKPEQPIIFGRNFDSAPGLSASDTAIAFQEALDDWNAACGLNLVRGEYNDCHVKQWLESLSGGTLAIALLSMGTHAKGRHWQKYDSSGRRWSKNMLRGTNIHESGHTLGYSHSNQGIMRPYMDPNVTLLQDYDIRRAQKDYGKPFDQPTPPDPPNPPSPGGTVIRGVLTDGSVNITFDDKGMHVIRE